MGSKLTANQAEQIIQQAQKKQVKQPNPSEKVEGYRTPGILALTFSALFFALPFIITATINDYASRYEQVINSGILEVINTTQSGNATNNIPLMHDLYEARGVIILSSFIISWCILACILLAATRPKKVQQ